MSGETQGHYTLAQWQVKPGEEEAFVQAWEDLGRAFGALSAPPPEGSLLRSLEDPQRYVSFGPWPDLAAIGAMREDPQAQEAIAKVRAHCLSACPGAYELVRHVRTN